MQIMEMTKQEKNFVLQGIAAWVPMPFIAVLNAGFREEVLRPMLGAEWAGLLGSVTLLAGLYLCAWFFLTRVMTPCRVCAPIVVASIWVALSLAFEFFITVVWLQRPFAEFAHVFGYANIGDGNFSITVLAALFFAPYVFSTRESAAVRRNSVHA